MYHAEGVLVSEDCGGAHETRAPRTLNVLLAPQWSYFFGGLGFRV